MGQHAGVSHEGSDDFTLTWSASGALWGGTNTPIGIANCNGAYYLERMTTVSFKLPAGLLRQVEQEAAVRGVPKSVVIRDCIERTFFRRNRKKPSCLDLMGNRVGSFSGPRDLSTNKKHLQDALLAGYERQQRKNAC